MIEIHLSFETELLEDAIREVDRIHVALVHRHGAEFRDLEHMIEALDPKALGEPDLASIGEGSIVVVPAKALLDIIAEGKRLGV